MMYLSKPRAMLSNKPSTYRDCRIAAAPSSFSSSPTLAGFVEEDDEDTTDEVAVTGGSSDAEADATNFIKLLLPDELVEETHQLTVRNLGSGSSKGDTEDERWDTITTKRGKALELERGISLAAVVAGIAHPIWSIEHGWTDLGQFARNDRARLKRLLRQPQYVHSEGKQLESEYRSNLAGTPENQILTARLLATSFNMERQPPSIMFPCSVSGPLHRFSCCIRVLL
jgi:hypothetical protein